MPVPKHRHLQQQVRVLRDEDVESFAWRRKGRLFLREHPWSAWSCDLIFVKQTRKKDDVYEMEGAQCQFQMTVEREERGGVNLNLKVMMKSCVSGIATEIGALISSVYATRSL